MLWADSCLAVIYILENVVKSSINLIICLFTAKGSNDPNAKNELSRNGKSETAKKKEQ